MGYVLWCYEFLFGVVTCLLEAPDDWLEHAPDQPGMINKGQAFVKEHAKFLTTEGGRGLFYLFQGSIMMALERFSIELSLFLAVYMFGLGALLIAMQYGFD